MALVVLSTVAVPYLRADERSWLLATMIAVLLSSQLVASGPQMLIMRYLAERLYLKDVSDFMPTGLGMLLLILPFTVIALPFLIFAPFEIADRFLITTLFLILAEISLLVTFLATARRYLSMVLILLLGAVCALLFCQVLGALYGVRGSLAGFTLGQMLCLSVLLLAISRAFPAVSGVSLVSVTFLHRFWDLFVIGALYALSLHIDGLIFGWSEQGAIIDDFYRLFAPYETARLVGLLSTIPAWVSFLRSQARDFQPQVRRYYRCLQARGTLAQISEAKEELRQAVGRGIRTISKIQGAVTIFLCLVAQDLASLFGLSERWVLLLRIQLLAALAFLLATVLLLFLLDLGRRPVTVLYVCLLLVGKGGLTLLTLSLGTSFYGTGTLLAGVCSALLGWRVLSFCLKRLDSLTSREQPWDQARREARKLLP